MASSQIITLCPVCAREYEAGFRVKRIMTETTTAKRGDCEGCRKRFPADILAQYMISAKRR